MKRAAVPPLYRRCIFPQGRPPTQYFGQGQRDWKNIAAFEKREADVEISKKILKLAVSNLGGLEAQV